MFVELGLTEDQFLCMTPAQTFLLQLQNNRKNEHIWVHTRQIMAMVHNCAMGVKRRLRPEQIIKLSIDKPVEHKEWTRDEALDLINKWSNKN